MDSWALMRKSVCAWAKRVECCGEWWYKGEGGVENRGEGGGGGKSEAEGQNNTTLDAERCLETVDSQSHATQMSAHTP